MPVALRKRKGDGTPYQRLPEVEALITKLEEMDAAIWLPQLDCAFKNHPDYVPTEVVLYFLRQSWRDSERVRFERIFRILIQRIDNTLRSKIWDSRICTAAEIRDEIVNRFVVFITQDCNSPDDRLDFYEVHFDQAMLALRTSVLRKFKAKAGEFATVQLGSQEPDSPEIPPEAEAALESFLSGDPQKIDDPAFRSVLFSAIDRLPDDQRRVIGLHLQGFPIDAKDKNTMTIARILNCDERTVRNRRDRACKTLKEILEAEAEL